MRRSRCPRFNWVRERPDRGRMRACNTDTSLTSAHPLASISLWLNPLFLCFLRWSGMGTTVHLKRPALLFEAIHSRAIARPSCTPSFSSPPYFRAWTSLRSSASAASQAQPQAHWSLPSNRPVDGLAWRAQLKSHGLHQLGSLAAKGVPHEAQRRGRRAVAM